ncbi:uncharacterized protein C05D11.1-like isoform X2 [Pseudomyrmex gracilis]|uniref:uncharacterized protein C05D11.1-like isoform X2 n=1 Tax=Pseudomyrmex gracilis TaxID=219809 RepID=UPI000995A87C|nr:uncharacterized protein C05D11.1-like isoform X2 [Pseudomyrmex gracilis]
MANRSEFKQMRSLMIEKKIPFYVYKSVNTGITICFAETKGPYVSGYFNINHANEMFSDRLPRVLEHLIFTGSEKYPYYGTLDKWRERCRATFSSESSHYYTYYQVTTPTTEEFLYLLPVYLDHIFYPTLTKSAFLTEIHHINGKGEDAGKFYCKQKSVDPTLEFIVMRDTVRAIFKNNDCHLFEMLNDDDMRYFRDYDDKTMKWYHKKFFTPNNLTIFIAGQVKHDTIFKALMPLVQKLISQEPYYGEYDQRINTQIYVIYPCTSTNIVMSFIWQEPSLVNEIYKKLGCYILWSYIVRNGSIQNIFNESRVIENAKVCLCADFHTSVFNLQFIGNEGDMLKRHFSSRILDQLKMTMKWSLLKVLSKFHENGVNMETIRIEIDNINNNVLSSLKNEDSQYLANIVFNYIRFGEDTNALDEMCNILHNLKKLKVEPQSFWINLFEKYFVNQPMITFVKSLEEKEMEKYIQRDEERIKEQIEELGPDGLKQKEMELQEAIREIEKPIPEEVLANMPIPRTF